MRFVVHPVHRRQFQHYAFPEDVRVVLGRLPQEVRSRLREVHLNDRYGRHGCLGYACPRSGSLGLCALPVRVSLTNYLDRHECRAEEFGARLGMQWPPLAVRRFMLYYVLLHELGHLQDLPGRRCRRVPGERAAREFGHYWRRRLWSQVFGHPDPAHNPPQPEHEVHYSELVAQERWAEAVAELLKCPHPDDTSWHLVMADCYCALGDFATSEQYARQALALDPGNPGALGQWAICCCQMNHWHRAIPILGAYLELSPDGTHQELLARSLYHTGDQAGAWKAVETGLVRWPNDPPLNQAYSELLWLAGRRREARVYARKAEGWGY